MGLSPLLSCLLWATMVCVAMAQTPVFLVSAPRLLHVGVKEDVWVQMEWPKGTKGPDNVAVEMYLRNQITYDECSTRYNFNLNSRKNHINSQAIELTYNRASTCNLKEKSSNKYVQLVMTSAVLGKKAQVLSIPFSFKRGYIFIQTDKTIYTPKEAVNFRVFTLDHMMRPTTDSITSTVTNAEGLQVKKIQKIPEKSILTEKLMIPDISTTGTWRISAHYTLAPESNFTTEFEVKKYVLPNFEVKIVPELPYFQINKAQFGVKVEARYVYGEPVNGVVHVRFGVIDQTGSRIMLHGLEQQVKMDDGEGTIHVNRDDILKKIAQSKENLVGSTFYIAATVVEKASGTLEEKELTSVKFVTSPYNLDLSKTKKYYTPGTPAQIVAEVTYTDGTPASKVKVVLLKANTRLDSFDTNEEGMVVFQVNTDVKEKSQELTIRAEGSDGRQEEILHLTPYTSKTSSFLHMEVPSQVLNPGEYIKVTVKLITPHSENVQRIYYMVLNKGQIMDVRSIAKTEFMVISIPVSTKMTPSFRLIIYYFLNSEIVANSVWIDVSDVCEGKLQIRTDVKDSIFPGKEFKLTLETDEETSVSLSAVDTAVYLLNSKSKLTASKVFKAMNDYDLGCSPGGGRDVNSVFMDAGVVFVSSFGYSDLSGLGCRGSQRKKRAIDFAALSKQKADHYSSPDLKKCCNRGMTLLPPRMDRDCDKRSKRVESGDCRNAFLDCCKYAEDLRKSITLEKRRTVIGRTHVVDQDEEEFPDESEVQIRSKFPESWLWKTIKVNKHVVENIPVPDSITTWEIQAVGMSTGKGFCVADPVKVKVFKPFHIYLRVPLTVKRFEQIELRPVLYNYEDHQLKVKVFVEKTEGMCTPSTPDGGTVAQFITVANKSALAIPFSVVPVGKENPTVTVMAIGSGMSDAVKKVLHIEREGVPVLEERTYVLNPEDKARSFVRIDEDLPSNVIPGADFHSSVKITMDSPINTINNSLSSDGVSKLIRVPYGCGEQTMISTAPGVFAMRYLDQTEKWFTLPPDRKDQGLENMRNGYARILQYRKPDGSYGAWLNRPSSTWLTSFVVKVMSLCRKYIEVDVEEIRKSVAYLITKQASNGAFLETTTVIHQEMMGGVSGANADVPLTAYVLIALHHAEDSLAEDDTKTRSSIAKAIDYLRSSLNSLSEPYPLAITAYALSLASTDSILKSNAYKKLMSIDKGASKLGELYFGPQGTALAVETTSYALLTALLHKQNTHAKDMYTWLSEQQNYGGGFKSTQDTVMALEALTEYWIENSDNDRSALELEINSLEKSQKMTIILRDEDSIQEELRSMGKKFTVKVSGKGSGILTVLRRYNIMKTTDTDCAQLGLEVTVFGDDSEKLNDDDEDYDYEEDTMADEPLQNIHWHDLRSRARREVSQPKEKDVKVVYSVCLKRKANTRATGMAIVDITMLSGFEPSTQDLNKLTGEERYISHYEFERGRLLMYFDEVTTSEFCVGFEAFQTVKVSPLQPASAVLYDFYEPGNQCRVFYNAPSRTIFISTLCSGDVCQCAEGPCPTLTKTLAIKKVNERQEFACYSPRVMYGYRVKVLEMKPEDAFIVYNIQIIEVLQKNKDEAIMPGDTRYFYQRSACKMRLVKEIKEYLIMGQDGQTEDEENKMRYFLENNSWVEELASTQACKATRNRNNCADMNTFLKDYQENGCKV